MVAHERIMSRVIDHKNFLLQSICNRLNCEVYQRQYSNDQGPIKLKIDEQWINLFTQSITNMQRVWKNIEKFITLMVTISVVPNWHSLFSSAIIVPFLRIFM